MMDKAYKLLNEAKRIGLESPSNEHIKSMVKLINDALNELDEQELMDIDAAEAMERHAD